MNLLRLLRVHHWGIQLPIFWTAAATFSLVAPALPNGFLRLAAVLSLAQALLLSGAYAFNDYCDWIADAAKHGSRDRGSRSLRLVIATACIAGSLVLVHALASHAAVVGVMWLQAAGSVAYSAPPLRLKERGIAGPLTAAALQRVPPFAALALWAGVARLVAAAIAVWLLAVGLRFIVEHQVQDLAVDRDSGARTLLLELEPDQRVGLRRSLNLLLPAAAAAVVVVALVLRPGIAAAGAAALIAAATVVLHGVINRYYAGNAERAAAVAAPLLGGRR